MNTLERFTGWMGAHPPCPCVLLCVCVRVRRMSRVCFATDLGYFTHVTRDHPFQDSGLFYRFTEDEKTGGVAADATGQKVSAGA